MSMNINAAARLNRSVTAIVWTLLFCLIHPLHAFAQAQYAGVYTGLIYAKTSGQVNSPETSIGAVLLSVDSAGNISQAGVGLTGRVNAAGTITWDTPNVLYVTTGTIVSGKMAATGVLVSGGGDLTTTFRLDATGSSAISTPEADPVLDTLTWVNPAPFGSALQQVLFQGGQFIAVGGGGLVATSPDGRTWAPRKTPTRRTLSGIAFGNGVYVAVGDGETIITSPDAISWTLRATTNFVKFDLSAVAYGSGRFLAVGKTGTSMYSTDGVLWTSRPQILVSYVDVVYAGAKFIITSTAGSVAVNTSTDGITWNVGAALPVSGVFPTRGIAFGGGKYLITTSVGNDSKTKVFTSPDGAAWTLVPNLLIDGAASGLTFKNAVFDGSKFVVFDNANYFSYTSTDGAAWTRGKGLSRDVRSIAFGGGKYVTVGDTIATSTNAMVWDDQVARRHLPHINFVGGDISKKVFVGQGGYYDRFGLNVTGLGVTNDLWSAVAVATSVSDHFMGDGGFLRFNGIDYFVPGRERLRGSIYGETYWYFGDNGALYQPKVTTLFTNNTALNIITNFVRIPTGTTADLLGSGSFTSGTFLFGRGGTLLRAGNFQMTNWLSVPTGTTVDLYAGAKSSFSGALAVVVGDQGTILTSSNGTTWTKRPSGTTDKLVGVAYHEQSSLGVSNRVYLAIGEAGTTVMSYDNGSNWTATANNFGRKVRSLNYAGNSGIPSFIAVGENGLVVTTGDYTNWSQGKMDADFSRAVYGNGRWAVAGPYYCLTSQDGVRWDFHSFKYNGASRMQYGGGKFALVANGSVILTSPDAINWTEAYVAPPGLNLSAIAYGGGGWVAVGSGFVLVSPDGVSWSKLTALTGTSVSDVRYGNGVWVAVGSSGSRTYSTNGTTWTGNNSNLNDSWRALTYGKGLWVSVGSSGILHTSTNGIAWTARSLVRDYQFADVETVGDRFIAIGYSGSTNVALVSTNGTNWTALGLPFSQTVNGLTAANGTLLMVGEKGMILQAAYAVAGLPAVSVSPSANQTIAAGNVLTLQATVTGLAPFQYLWSRNGVPLVNNSRVSGATSATLVVSVNATEDGGDYTVEVVNAVGSRVSFPITVMVTAPPTFLTQPASQTGVAGGKVTFSVNTKGTGVTYQWYKNGNALANQTNAVLALTGLLGTDAGAYSVVASNANGSRTSAAAALSISAPPTFSVDAGYRGGSLSFSNWPGYGAGYVYAIRPLADGRTLLGGTFKVTSGATVFTGLLRLNADGTLDTSFTPPTLVPAVYYHGAVRTILPLPDGRFLLGGDQQGGKGLVLIQANGTAGPAIDPGFLSSGNAPYINSLAMQADGKIVMAGLFVLNGVYNHGRLNGDLTLDSPFGVAVPSEASSIAVQPNQQILVGGQGIIRLTTTGVKDFNFQQIVAGYVTSMQVMPDGRIALGGQNIAAGGRTNIIMLGTDGAVDGNFQANADATVFALARLADDSLVAGGFFTTINGIATGQLGLVRKDGTLDANFKYTLSPGGIVYSLAADASGAILVGGSFKSINGTPATNLARIVPQAAGVALAIVSDPKSASADLGDTVTLSVAASGGAPLNFQWRKDGAPIQGATLSSLTLTNVSTNAVANYTVAVTDPSGSVTSQAAGLTVAGVAPSTVQLSGFDAWAVAQNLPANARGSADDPDGDRVPNLFEYYFGTNPNSAASFSTPQGTSVRVGADTFPALTFVRTKSATGVSATVLVSSTVKFLDSLGAAAETVTDLGNGTERVVIRSTVNDRTQPVQFLKLRLALAP